MFLSTDFIALFYELRDTLLLIWFWRRYFGRRREVPYTHRHGLFWDGAAAAGDAAGELPALLDMCTSGQSACDKMWNHGYVHIMLRLSVYVATQLPRMSVHETFVDAQVQNK